MKHLYVLTGASRGLGLAMARQLLQPGNTLLCISRNANETLAVQAKQADADLLQWTQDLALGVSTSARLEQWLREQVASGFASATLITMQASSHASGL